MNITKICKFLSFKIEHFWITVWSRENLNVTPCSGHNFDPEYDKISL